MSTCQDPVPESHATTSKRISQHRQRRKFYIHRDSEDELPMSITEELSSKEVRRETPSYGLSHSQ